MKKQFKKIKSTSKIAKEKTIFERLACLTEEVGELSQALLAERGIKSKKLKEPASSEAVDVVVTALCIYIMEGGSYKNLKRIMSKKIDKWINSLE